MKGSLKDHRRTTGVFLFFFSKESYKEIRLSRRSYTDSKVIKTW